MKDPIERLRAADPVPEPVSHPSDGPVRATLEEILMTDTATRPPADADHRPGGPAARWFQSPRLLAVAAALLLVVGVAGAALVGGSSDEPADVARPTAPTDGVDPGAPADPTDGGITQETACVEMYSLETLPNRTFAFDGTVVGVDGQDMTFEVHEWFRGGESATVTLDHQGYAGMLFAPEGPALEPGTRVLAAGDDGFVWSCGFTQLHDPDLADQWRSTLAG